ncbi:hypothetical protein BCON_0111g00220 [Botryotinia convoluta]|uniref:Uncharacterized protein n=1 Tax=Botryotinia convoluta TaxID=54673 RepID=A0A4Z1HY52_9HELO|nr:hypothetical protein BCON_0111g00220 [Botryotinia convoluta]
MPPQARPQKKVPYASMFTEHVDGPIEIPSPRFVDDPRAPIPRTTIPPPIIAKAKNTLPQPVKVGEESGCGCVVM